MHSTGHLIFGVIFYLIISPLTWKSYEHANVTRFKRKFVKRYKNRISSFTLYLSEEGLTKESQNLTEKLSWDELESLTEDEERYFLYLTDLSAITIKKEPNNMNEEEIIEYQSFIKRKMSNELNNKT